MFYCCFTEAFPNERCLTAVISVVVSVAVVISVAVISVAIIISVAVTASVVVVSVAIIVAIVVAIRVSIGVAVVSIVVPVVVASRRSVMMTSIDRFTFDRWLFSGVSFGHLLRERQGDGHGDDNQLFKNRIRPLVLLREIQTRTIKVRRNIFNVRTSEPLK